MRLLIPVLLVSVIVLNGMKVLPLGIAAYLLVAAEAVAIGFVAWHFITARRAYKAGLEKGLKPSTAVEFALRSILPSLLARFTWVELQLWYFTVIWLFRRWRRLPIHFSYMRRSIFGAILVIALIAGIGEAVVLHLLLPWHWLRVVALILNVYFLLWLIGVYAAMKVKLHDVAEDSLHLNFGLFASVSIPYTHICSIKTESLRSPGGSDGLHVVEAKGEAWISSGSRTDLTIALNSPATVEGFLKKTPPVTVIHVAVDASDEFVKAVESRKMSKQTDSVLSPDNGSPYL